MLEDLSPGQGGIHGVSASFTLKALTEWMGYRKPGPWSSQVDVPSYPLSQKVYAWLTIVGFALYKDKSYSPYTRQHV